MLEAIAQQFTVTAVLCPHQEARQHQTVYVRDPESGASMGLCSTCRVMFTGLSERAGELVGAGDRGRDQVLATLLAHGYGEEDAAQFWGDLVREVTRT